MWNQGYIVPFVNINRKGTNADWALLQHCSSKNPKPMYPSYNVEQQNKISLIVPSEKTCYCERVHSPNK